ncbi:MULTISPECIES: hypothetical protein [unclassified Halomonas]|uniref:hypothetical protein n=1 Tax=unclassified Halomonas TaxID=2609666 RepID=UPI0020769CA9|nr:MULTISPECIES: hypothetical protein [unclassified Halomonas]
MSGRTINAQNQYQTTDQALTAALATGRCSDGQKCGMPPSLGDDRYCAECPNQFLDNMPTHSKYHREIKPGVWVDVYDILQAWDVRNSALQHLIKKALAPGQRGHKDLMTDMDDIIASAKRAKELEQ